ncbi:hypothetical protein F5Y19DRAFT_460986 [Xylariaceae sp. FL1651]|nr:hypothetical protein F5Y19DRAFT_460986 [Xylariaceae sp. FL1651]
MASQPRTHNDYTVGWVCALPKEQTAAIAMLDQRHPELPKPLNDSNTYTLGSIGEHNIVVACLPKGKIGTNSAATVAVLMITAFPAIRFGLMVGIGGGIPPYVRLGDVVVSAPTDQYPGVVQWDVGKAEHGGKSKRTGALNNPPLSLLTALARLETEHEMTGPRIPEILEEMGKTWPRLAAKYLRSDLLNDTLFEPDYQHSNEDPKGRNVALVYGAGDKEDSCRYCDGSRAIQRVPREMQVHYGLIASGNIVIKDAIFRDKLCQDLGGNVLCVEMEAAGLMNNFPCLVIRGICDYADSHKNKIWQEHAAATAAAFAKELLGYVQPSDVDHEKRVKDILYHIFNVVDSIKEDIGYTKLRLYEKEDLEILDWLIPSEYDYGLQQTDNLRRRQPGTGQWLLDSKEYCEWVREPNKTLFCPGIPGSGKTIMTSIVVDDLEDRFRINEATTAVAYIYCNYKRQNDQTVENLLSSLLKQLLAQCQLPLPRNLKELYERHKTKRTRPSLDEISKALEFATAQNSKVFIVIDALDELQASNGFLSSIFDLQIRTGVNLFVTSRNVPRITARFKECISKEIRATESDIRRYLQANIAKLPSFIANQHNLQDEIVRGITKGVDGMYFTINEIREALNRLMEGGPSPYDSAYRTAMERINGQLEGQARRAKQVLSWVTCAKRQLTKVELQHALGIKIDETKIDKDNLPWIEDLVSVCAGLIAVDQKSSIVRLVHYTTQEYFVRTQNDWFLNTELSITEICLSYLSYQVFANGYSDTDETFEERLRLYPFYDYAARNWGHHGRSLLANHRILSFLRKPAQLQASSQVLMLNNQYKYGNYSQRTPKHMTGLHLAAFFGLKEVVMTLLHEYNTDVKDSHSRTPLSYAAENGHEAIAIVQLLLQTERVDPDSKDEYGWTPLLYAAGRGHKAIVQLLLQTERVDPDLP